MKIGKLIRLDRTVSGTGIRDAAATIGITASTLSRIENGKKIDAVTLAKLFNFFFDDL